MSINNNILATLIQNQKRAIKYQIIFASLVIILGFCIILFSLFFFPISSTPSETVKLALSLGGGFISTISAYPINQIITRKEKIKTYEIFILSINELSENELKRVEEIIWKSVEKIL